MRPFSLCRLKKEMLERVQVIVQEEIRTALKDQQTSLQQDVMAAIRSQAATPVPQAQDIQHIQAKIKQLIEQKHINAAFQHVSNTSTKSRGREEQSLIGFVWTGLNNRKEKNVIVNEQVLPNYWGHL